MYGRTAVDFGSVVGSFLAVGPLVFVTFFVTNEYGYPLETRTDDKCQLLVRCLVRSYKHLNGNGYRYHSGLVRE